MAFHINENGDPGKCKASKGKCPFGGEHQHYDTVEKAQQAFELSMAGSTLATPQKKTEAKPYPVDGDTVIISHHASTHDAKLKDCHGKTGIVKEFTGSSYTVTFDDGSTHNFHYSLVAAAPEPVKTPSTRGYHAVGAAYNDSLNRMTIDELADEASCLARDKARFNEQEYNERLEAVEKARASYYPRNYNGFEKAELIFDEADFDARTLKALEKYPPNKFSPEELAQKKAIAIANWAVQARTEPAKPYEDRVPIRLIPAGAEVYASYAKGSPWRKVGVPVDNGPVWNPKTQKADLPNDIVGKYHDGVQWDYVGPETTFKTGNVPQGKKISPRWQAANARAAELKLMREKAALDGVK